MMTPDDHALLQQFAADQSEAAFAALVDRHLPLVHSAALRRAHGDAHLAAEIAQATFIILARKAGDISAKTVLTGWLYRTTQYVAADALRQKLRRQQREHQAYMEATLTPNETNEAWQQLAPVLDEAMHALRTADRDAVLLRFFENKSLADVGAALGVTEDAARVRVNRALDKLRALLAKQGIKFGATAIATAVAANAVSAAPATLAASITTAVLTGTSLTLATIAMTTLQKIAVTAALTVTIGGGLFAAKQAHDAQNAMRTLQAQQAPMAEQLQQLQAERDKATNRLAAIADELARANGNNSELLKLRGEATMLRNQARAVAQLKSNNSKDEPGLADKSWLDRVGLLKQRLDQNPQAKIPELQFLTEQDWLNAASHKLDTDEDFQTAFASLRAGGESHFLNVAEKALRKYLEANQGQFPPDLAQLKPYFENPPTDEMLQRYQIVPASDIPQANLGGKPADSLITLKVQDSDALMTLGPTGVSGSSYQDSEIMAILAPAMKALLAATPMINGKKQMDIQQLSPYLTTPEQRAAYQQLMQRHNLSSKK